MIRDVQQEDHPAINKFLRGLGYNVTQESLEKKLALFREADSYRAMIDMEEDTVNGIIGLQILHPLHTRNKVGRITSLVIDESYRGNRAGRLLVEAADEYFRETGCGSSEVPGGLMRSPASKIFTALGFVAGERQFLKRYPRLK